MPACKPSRALSIDLGSRTTPDLLLIAHSARSQLYRPHYHNSASRRRTALLPLPSPPLSPTNCHQHTQTTYLVIPH
jgi:hypothetical protein